ncbi:bacteriophage large tail fiber protein [Pseudomonas putida S11]|nr:bacteriophage large tail fiber protein [Pseudomonas putida S11]
MTNALAAKAPLASPTFTGSPKAPTQALTVNDTTLATTQFAQSLLGASGWGAGGFMGSNLPNGTNLNNVVTPGSYGQPMSAQTSLELNYPEADAGTLLVQAATAGIVTQLYTLYRPTNRVFLRTCYAGNWSAWSELSRLDSPVFTGTPKGPTAPLATNNQQLANTAFVYGLLNQLGLGGVGIGMVMPDFDDATVPAGMYYVNSSTLNLPFGGAGGVLIHKVLGSIGFQLLFPNGSDRLMWRRRTASIWQAWNDVATLDSPTFSGAPTAPTALKGTKSKQLATTEFVHDAIATLVDSSPGALDTLRELANALANDPNFATTMTNQLATKAPLASPAFTGTPTAPTLGLGANALGLVNLQHLRNTLNQYGLAAVNTGALPATLDELPGWPAGNYYYPTSVSPYPSYAFVMRLVYSNDKGFEIANIPYTDRVFLRSSNGDGTWRAPMELAPLVSPAFSGVPTCPTAPTTTNNGQLASTAFVRNVVIQEGVQPGEISFFAGAAAPRGVHQGKRRCGEPDGLPGAVRRHRYHLRGLAMGTTTFNVPDIRGEFVRGLDDGRGVDPGRVLGSWQNHLYASHTHAGTTDTQGAHGATR